MEKEIIIKIEGKEWEEALDVAFKKANEKVKIDGFRPGKAPKEVFMKKYGVGSLLMDAAETEFHHAYHKMLDETKGLDIVAKPAGDIKKLEETYVEYVFTVTLRPEVKLGKYKKLGVEKADTSVSKEEIAMEVEKTLYQYAELQMKDGAIENGDVIVMDFEGSKDGVLFDGGTAKDYSLTVGSNSFIPGFEDQLIGMTKGEVKSFDITFPENYHSSELKGAKTTFKVTINEIKTKKLPELNAEFFEDFAMEGVDSKESLEAQLEENLKAQKEHNQENDYLNKLFDAATKEMEVIIPEAMLIDEVERILDGYEQQLKMQGIDLKTYFQMTNSTEEDLKNMMKPEAESRVKTRLMLEEVAKVEKLDSTEEEANNLLSEMASKYNVSTDELLAMYGDIEPLKYEIKMRKAIDILKA